VVTLSSVSLYYADAYVELWGVLQRLNFVLTTIWLYTVLLTVKPKSERVVTNGYFRADDSGSV
jgi:hypothetical protein